MLSRSVLFALLAAATACGDDHHNKPDAQVFFDGPPDSPPDASSNGCDYTEQHDSTNDYNLTSGFVAEETGIAFSGATKTICGIVNNGHYSSTNGSIDIDDYRFTVTADADVIVSVTGALGSISSFGIFAVDSGQKAAGSGFFIHDHGVFSAHLVAGSYEISAEAYDNQDLTGTIPYKIKFAADMPTTRCPQVTALPNYTESHDGTSSNGNDTIQIDFSATPNYQLTASTTDAPEPGISVVSGTNYRMTGISAMVAKSGDTYYDKDTYIVTTDSATDQLAIRLNWADTTADLDYYVFNPNLPTAPFAASAKVKVGEDEFATFAVTPSSMYWVWVGAASAAATPVGYPYDVSVCGETFTP